jgi:hypothetical protein
MGTAADPATNRIGTTDANGNAAYTGFEAYDVENRLLQTIQGWTGPIYTYDGSNKRVFAYWPEQQTQNPPPVKCEIYFYGITGQRLATYNCGYNASDGAFWWNVKGSNLYFGGKLLRSSGVAVATDRLGSVRGLENGTPPEKIRYYPYGQERATPPNPTSPNDREKFGTYFRDNTGLDYADQRYYDSGVEVQDAGSEYGEYYERSG